MAAHHPHQQFLLMAAHQPQQQAPPAQAYLRNQPHPLQPRPPQPPPPPTQSQSQHTHQQNLQHIYQQQQQQQQFNIAQAVTQLQSTAHTLLGSGSSLYSSASPARDAGAQGAQVLFKAPAHKHAHHLHSIPPREKSTRTLIIDHMLWVHGRTRLSQARAELGMTDLTGGPTSTLYTHRTRPENYEEEDECPSESESLSPLLSRLGPENVEEEEEERRKRSDFVLARGLRLRAEGLERVVVGMLEQKPVLHPGGDGEEGGGGGGSPGGSPVILPGGASASSSSSSSAGERNKHPHTLPNGVRLRLALGTIINDLFARQAPTPPYRHRRKERSEGVASPGGAAGVGREEEGDREGVPESLSALLGVCGVFSPAWEEVSTTQQQHGGQGQMQSFSGAMQSPEIQFHQQQQRSPRYQHQHPSPHSIQHQQHQQQQQQQRSPYNHPSPYDRPSPYSQQQQQQQNSYSQQGNSYQQQSRSPTVQYASPSLGQGQGQGQQGGYGGGYPSPYAPSPASSSGAGATPGGVHSPRMQHNSPHMHSSHLNSTSQNPHQTQPHPSRPIPTPRVKKMYHEGADPDTANSPPAFRCPRHLHTGCEICVEATSKPSAPPRRSAASISIGVSGWGKSSSSGLGLNNSTLNSTLKGGGGITGWEEDAGIGSGLLRTGVGGRGSVLRRRAGEKRGEEEDGKGKGNTKLSRLIPRFVRLSALVAAELGRESGEGVEGDGEDGGEFERLPESGDESVREAVRDSADNGGEGRFFEAALRPTREWYMLLAGLLTRAVLEGYLTAGWRGSKPMECLLTFGLGIREEGGEGQKSREEEEWEEYEPDELPSLFEAVKILFPSLRKGGKGRREGPEEEYAAEMVERLRRFYDVPASTPDLSTHMEDLAWSYPAEPVERAAVRYCEAIAKWRGKPELETYKKKPPQAVITSPGSTVMTIESLVHSNPTSPQIGNAHAVQQGVGGKGRGRGRVKKRPSIDTYFAAPLDVQVARGLKRGREEEEGARKRVRV